MRQSPEAANNTPGFDRCVDCLELYLRGHGRPMDLNRGHFRPPAMPTSCDALVAAGAVDARDSTTDEPIVYDTAWFTELGMRKYGLLARLHQVIEPLQREVIYEFTTVGQVRRKSFQFLPETPQRYNLTEEPAIAAEEVEILAEQLASLRPADQS